MRIGIDASRANSMKRTGVENYAFFVIEELKKQIAKEQTVVLYSRESLMEPLSRLPHNWTSRVLRIPFRRLWTQIRLSLEMELHRPDVLYVLAHVMPLVYTKKTLVTIHDVAPERFPESYSWFERWYARFSTRFALRHAWKIIVPSLFTKKEIIELFRVPEKRAEDIVMIPAAYDHARFHLRLNQEQVDETLNNLGIRRPYALYVGRLEEKKDVVTLITAYTQARAQHALPFQLVLVGKPGYGHERVAEAIAACAFLEDIIELGYADDAALAALYSEAEVVSYATKYEGFGIPVLEAQACGTPVIIRTPSATEELANETALVVDGTADSLAKALLYVFTDSEWKARKERAQELAVNTQVYNWERTAQAVAQLMMQREDV